MRPPKRFVYILESVNHPASYYVGVTSDMEARLCWHNSGLSSHTAAHRPWRRLVVIEFDAEQPAVAFEKYLKSGSGREFARRHFRQSLAGRSFDAEGRETGSAPETLIELPSLRAALAEPQPSGAWVTLDPN